MKLSLKYISSLWSVYIQDFSSMVSTEYRTICIEKCVNFFDIRSNENISFVFEVFLDVVVVL